MNFIGVTEQGWKVCQLDREDWQHFQSQARYCLEECVGVGLFPRAAQSWDRCFLGTMDRWEWLKMTLLGLEVDGQIVSTHIVTPSKKSHGKGGRKLTSNFAYTICGLRQLSYASTLLRWIETWAYNQGMKRLKTRIGSYLGFRLHWSIGHDIWGVEKEGEEAGYLVVNSPLEVWKRGEEEEKDEALIPDLGRTGRSKMTREELFEVLTDPNGKFHAPKEEVTKILQRRK